MITSDKTDKTKNGKKKREKQGKSLYKGKVVNTTNWYDNYEPNIRAYKYIKQQLTELMRKINSIVIINNNIWRLFTTLNNGQIIHTENQQRNGRFEQIQRIIKGNTEQLYFSKNCET